MCQYSSSPTFVHRGGQDYPPKHEEEGPDHSPPPSRMATTLSIPIPQHTPSYPSSIKNLSPSSARSPSSSSLSSYRSHPYYQQNRRASNPLASSIESASNLSNRIQLPPPNSSAPLKVGMHDRSPAHEVLPLSHLALGSPSNPWDQVSSHPAPRRTPSGLSLPPLHTLTAPAPDQASPSITARLHTPTSMGPPSFNRPESPSGPGRISPRAFSTGSLRPSYAYESSSTPTGRVVSPSAASNSRWREEYFFPSDRNTRAPQRASPPTAYPEHSPPLRSIHHPPAHAAGPSARSPEKYYSGPSYAQGAESPYHPPATRHLSHSVPGGAAERPRDEPAAVRRGGGPEEAEGSSRPKEGGVGHGQNRRLAHLMSEQKRRESINTGFSSLRHALPGAIATDSKAIILRKAVSRITHLEALLKKAGVSYPTTSSRAVPREGEEWGGGDVGDEVEGDIEMDGEEGPRGIKEEEWEDEGTGRYGNEVRGKGSGG